MLTRAEGPGTGGTSDAKSPNLGIAPCSHTSRVPRPEGREVTDLRGWSTVSDTGRERLRVEETRDFGPVVKSRPESQRGPLHVLPYKHFRNRTYSLDRPRALSYVTGGTGRSVSGQAPWVTESVYRSHDVDSGVAPVPGRMGRVSPAGVSDTTSPCPWVVAPGLFSGVRPCRLWP